MSLWLSAYHVASQAFLDENDSIVKRLVFATRKAAVVVIPEECWIAIRNGNLAALPESMVAELCEIELLVPADTDELAIVLGRQRAASATDDRLTLVIQPTAACQLACSYCGQEHSRTHLSEAHQDLFIASTRRSLATGRYRALG